ncbi:MAG: hypothetical protein ACRDQ4_13675 [Pseudonocardiaceae bacterium]
MRRAVLATGLAVGYFGGQAVAAGNGNAEDVCQLRVAKQVAKLYRAVSDGEYPLEDQPPTSFPRSRCDTASYPATPRVVDLGTLRCSPRAGQLW